MNLNDNDKNRIIELIKAGEKLPKKIFINSFPMKKMYSSFGTDARKM
jgi:hypothetical protein